MAKGCSKILTFYVKKFVFLDIMKNSIPTKMHIF